MTLPQMAYGYEMQLTPLKMLSFYNAVANNGKYVAPIFVREIRRLGNTVETFHARVIDEKICSEVTLSKMQKMLRAVVTEGTGKTLNNPLYQIAGKTGTAQVADANKGYKAKKQYQASFCGYFPADHPKYSLIVVINDPKGGYYAAEVAGPPFKEIADKVYSSDLEMNQNAPIRFVGNTQMPKTKTGDRKAIQQVYSKLGMKPLYASNANVGIDTSNGVAVEEIKYKKGSVPAVVGMGLSDALYALGNAGYKVSVHGSGVVTQQSVTGGSLIPKGAKILIELQ
jgi:cell division protein FtsI (penicillin-binding protein 3)